MARQAGPLKMRTREQEIDRVYKFYEELHAEERRVNVTMAKALLWFGLPVLALIALAIYAK
ncbi:MAG: hypothetical protein U0105_01500 [Candidatus Obscuribacterales bacterium]